jgi:CRP/FNR family cyclic AMP-dependent transcriptional regulator
LENLINSTPLFQALDNESSIALRASMVELNYDKGSVVFNEGQLGDKLYIILSGKIKLGTTSVDGRESLLEVLGPGEMFGELSLFDPGPRTATASALIDSTLLGLGHESLGPWLTGRPGVAEALLKALAQRLRRTNESLSDLVFSDVPGRVAKALVELNGKFGDKRPEGFYVEHDLTQEELAQLVGASRETVNKALADFVQREWIKLEPRAVLLLDVERLEKRAR